jgi:excisionase family DNA binding protein
METVLKVRTVAEALGMDDATIARWCKQGHIPAVRISGTWFILESALDKLLVTGGEPNE